MEEAMIGLISAVGVVLIKGLFDYIMDRRKRRDTVEDRESSEKQEILTAIEAVKKDNLEAISELKTEIADVREEIKKNQEQMKLLDQKEDEGRTVQCRIRILSFADEISHGLRHSKDHFDQTMKDITDYNKYCHEHPDFENEITTSSVNLIRKAFQERLDKNDWL